MSFGILHIIIGNDANVDILQLMTQLSHNTEIQNILASNPSWDELESRSQHVDQIMPDTWKGDISVNSIEFLTSWFDGHSQAISLDQEIKTLLDSITTGDGINMLSPLGSLVIKFDDQNPISITKNSLEVEDEDDVWDATLHVPSSSICEDEELDLEDLISTPNAKGLDELASSSLSAYLTIEAKDGAEKKVHKACTLKVLFQEIINEKGSTDWQKHIQGLAHYSVKPTGTSDGAGNDSIFGESICIGNPAVTLVVVKQMVFLAVIQLSSLKLSAADVQQALISMLPEDNIVVGFHILTLKSVAVHECDEDWIWANRGLEQMAGKVKGKYIQPISPTVWGDKGTDYATFIFHKTKLQELMAMFISTIGRQGVPELTKISSSSSFPYHSSEGKFLDV